MADAEQIVEDAVEEVTEIVSAFAAKSFFLGLAAGAAGGVVVGYLVARNRLSTKFEQYANEEIDQMREHYLKKERVNEPKPNLEATVQNLGYASTEVPEVKSPMAGAVVFPGMPEEVEADIADARSSFVEEDVWNHEEEVVSRTAEVPYVIHKDEYKQGNFQGEPHEQATLTYFQEDDVLVDEKDQRIPDIDETIALENLEKFGHGSGDANVVYVRSHVLKTDFEILRSTGSYTSEVLGVVEEDDELEHSAMRRHRSRRSDDEEG